MKNLICIRPKIACFYFDSQPSFEPYLVMYYDDRDYYFGVGEIHDNYYTWQESLNVVNNRDILKIECWNYNSSQLHSNHLGEAYFDLKCFYQDQSFTKSTIKIFDNQQEIVGELILEIERQQEQKQGRGYNSWRIIEQPQQYMQQKQQIIKKEYNEYRSPIKHQVQKRTSQIQLSHPNHNQHIQQIIPRQVSKSPQLRIARKLQVHKPITLENRRGFSPIRQNQKIKYYHQ